VVFTRDFSDLSKMPDLSGAAPVRWCSICKRDSIETRGSVDGENFPFVRDGYFKPSAKVDVGIMCAAPEGSGFDATFDHLKLSLL